MKRIIIVIIIRNNEINIFKITVLLSVDCYEDIAVKKRIRKCTGHEGRRGFCQKNVQYS